MPKAAEAKAMAKDSAGDSVRHFINLAKAYEIRVSCAESRANHVAYNQGMQHRSTRHCREEWARLSPRSAYSGVVLFYQAEH